jgi:hypothetical protein
MTRCTFQCSVLFDIASVILIPVLRMTDRRGNRRLLRKHITYRLDLRTCQVDASHPACVAVDRTLDLARRPACLRRVGKRPVTR